MTTNFGEEDTLLGRLLEEAKRDLAAFPVAKGVYIAVDRDKARAGKRLTKTERAAHRIEEIPPWYRCASGIRVGRAIARRGLMLKCKT